MLSPFESPIFETGHKPVLLHEMLDMLQPKDSGVYLDGTFGGGGYTKAILESTNACVHALDRDPEAFVRSQKLKELYPDRFFFYKGSFSDLTSLFEPSSFDGIVFDFGVSSYQLDTPERGFSFRHDGPLDMRMNPSDQLNAATVVNTYSEEDIAKILFIYGEELKSRQIARAIVQARKQSPFTTTQQLTTCIHSIVKKKNDIDPATLTFQGLRIYVNNELIEIENALKGSINLIKNEGKILTVSFHSLEDRLCKQFFKSQLPWQSHELSCFPDSNFISLSKKPIAPSSSEIRQNPRCRSGKLRGAIFQKTISDFDSNFNKKNRN